MEDHFSEELQAFVNEMLSTGRYSSKLALYEDALRMLKQSMDEHDVAPVSMMRSEIHKHRRRVRYRKEA